MTRTLVAGGSGFLGSHLCEILLSRGHDVICLDSFQTGIRANISAFSNNAHFTVLQHDIRERLPSALEVDEIYNLACPASPVQYQADPVRTLLTCVNGTHHLLELAKRLNVRYLQASTSEVYGDPLQHPQTEENWGNVNPVGIRACYDEGKRAAETLCFDYKRMYGTDVRVARIFNTYGSRMRRDDGRIVSNFICQALEGKPLTIYGNGQQTRAFCHASDLVAGLVALMSVSRNPDMPINLGNPRETTVRNLAELILSLTDTASPIIFEPLPHDDPRRRCPDIGRASSILGWKPTISLEDGLQDTIAWFSATMHLVNSMPLESSSRSLRGEKFS